MIQQESDDQARSRLESVPGLSLSLSDVILVNRVSVELVKFLGNTPVEQLARWQSENADLYALLPLSFDIATFSVTRGLVIGFLKRADESIYEAVRLIVGRALPRHSAFLGLPEVRPWYYANMNRMRGAILVQLEGRGK